MSQLHCNVLQTASEEAVACPAADRVNFDGAPIRACMTTIHPCEQVATDAVVAGHSKQHLKDMVSVLLSMVCKSLMSVRDRQC